MPYEVDSEEARALRAGTWSNLTTPLMLEWLRELYRQPALRRPQPQVFFAYSFMELLGENPGPAPEAHPWRWPDETVEGDNVAQELVELVQAGDEAGFRALAGCVMPVDEVDECWCGTRARLGLA